MAETPEENTSSLNSQDATPGTETGGPFGLLADDRPMLPAEEPIPAQDNKGSKTTGEKFYNRIQLAVGNVFILTATALLAYLTRYGKSSYSIGSVKIPNVLQGLQKWLNKNVMENEKFKLDERPVIQRVVGAFLSTLVIFHGGNFFAPVMRSLENHREKIVTYANKRWGKPGEAEAGHERLKDLPKQTWGDVIKGRIVAFLIVFGSFATTDAILGKDKKTGMYRFDQYEEWFGRKAAGLTKGGKEISKTPITQPLSPAQSANPAFRFSKILALDLYATTAGIITWAFISRLSAKLRKAPSEPAKPAEAPTTAALPQNSSKDETTPEKKTSFTAREGGKPKDFYAHATETPAAPGPTV